MAKIAQMTQLSPTMKEGVFVDWQKNEGDAVKPGDILASIETDKAVMDLEAFDVGVLIKKLAKKGDKLPVGAPIGVIGSQGENIDALLKDIAGTASSGANNPPTSTPVPPEAAQGTNATGTADAPQSTSPLNAPSANHGRIKASPLAKKVAEREGIALETIAGSGPGGRIVVRDLSAGATEVHTTRDARASDKRTAITPMRQTIAERLSYAKATVPHFYLSRSVRVSALLQLRESTNVGLSRLQKEHTHVPETLPQKISVNDYILAAAAQTLALHRTFLRQWNGDHILERGNIDVGFAVSLEEGLITPVLRNADAKNLFQIAAHARILGERARARKLKSDEYTGGVFTVTNLGMLGVSSFDAIINAPESAILAVGTTERRAYEGQDGTVQFGDFLTLNLACDHRVIDGAVGAQFLATLAHFLENPGLIR